MEDKLNVDEVLPEAPKITEQQWDKARKTGRYEAIAFEEYKFVAQMVAVVARIESSSPAFRIVPTQHQNILVGLMNRCARLMLATLNLSHQGKFGETSAIIFRCIIESGVKVIWLCTDPSQEKFDRYISDSLDPEVELKRFIQTNIESRGGEILPMESRMLSSIDFHIKKAQIKEADIGKTKKMPDTATLLGSVGFDRLVYLALYRMGSHHVHGTWPSLLFHYLEEGDKEDILLPRGNDASTRSNEYIAVSLIMIRAVIAYCGFVLDQPTHKMFKALMELSERDNLNIFNDMTKHGF